MWTPVQGGERLTFSAETRAQWNRAAFSASFAEELAAQLSNLLREAPGGATVEISIPPLTGGQDSATRQILVTLRTLEAAPSAPSPAPAAATATAPPAGPAQHMMYSGTVQYQPRPEPARPPATEWDAYWAQQPPELQQLRDIPRVEDREQKAWELARRGFSVDADIMVYHKDPYMTMKIREGEGYTWVPAWGQGGIPLAPGLQFPGLPAYNALNPPPGSIRVSYEFARGLEHTSPGWGGA
jgi:hypothetical protein